MKPILIIIFLALLPAFSFSQNSTSPDKAKTIAAELEKKDKLQKTNNSNNNTRSNKDRCCRDEIAPRGFETYIVFNSNTKWFKLNEANLENIPCPNPIVQLGGISASWVVELRTGEGIYLGTKNVQIVGNEMIISITGLGKGSYYIEIKNGNDFLRTGFRIGPDPNAMKELKPQLKKKGN